MRLHRYPSAAEAIEAVRESLDVDRAGDDAIAATYRARVGAHLLAVVERELVAERGDSWFDGQLALLGVDGEEALAASVRAGEWDDRVDELVAVLIEITEERLRIANPGWLAPVEDDDPRSAGQR